MDEMLGYIFSNLKHSEKVINHIGKNLKHQRSFNKSVAFFAATVVVYMWATEFQIKRQEEKIEELSSKISELKDNGDKPKGE